HVSRPHRRARGLRRALRQPDAPLHPGIAGGSAGARSDSRGRAHFSAGQGRGAEPDQSALGLRLPPALPDRSRAMQAGSARTARAAPGPLGRLQRGAIAAIRGPMNRTGGYMLTSLLRLFLIGGLTLVFAMPAVAQ